MKKFLREEVNLSQKEADDLEFTSYSKMMDFVYSKRNTNNDIRTSFRDMERSSIELKIPTNLMNDPRSLEDSSVDSGNSTSIGDRSKPDLTAGFFITINNGEDPSMYGYEELEFSFNEEYNVVRVEMNKTSLF